MCTEVPLELFDSLAGHPESSGPGVQEFKTRVFCLWKTKRDQILLQIHLVPTSALPCSYDPISSV